jgi:oligoendopeptidase F
VSNPTNLPEKATEMLAWSWSQFEPYYAELAGRSLTSETVEAFLDDWSRLHDRLDEVGTRLAIAKDLNTADKAAEQRFIKFLDEVYPKSQEAEQKLKTLILASGARPEGFSLPLRKIQTDAALFREANIPLQVEVVKLCNEYSKIVGSQTVQWDGKEVTVTQLRPVLQETSRERREKAWRLTAERQLRDREALNELWQKLLKLRLKMAENAGYLDYRAFRWQEMFRFDYVPQDCKEFQKAIAAEAVPSAERTYRRRMKHMGLEVLKPWDLDVDPLGRAPLAPFSAIGDLKAVTETMLGRVDAGLGGYFRTMVQESLLDLDNRKNKAPGAYCATFSAAQRPFIFMNAVGLHGDVMTLVHEGGHACHSFLSSDLPWFHQRMVGLEFAEVASMGLELLAEPYLGRNEGGFYAEQEAARARIENLEKIVQFWPYMAVVDSFQHWVYENPEEAMEPANCDRQWTILWHQFMPGCDWTGFDDVVATGWQRKLHIFMEPFYYVEYGLAQLGACQVWANALANQGAAVAAYKRALALGGTMSLPDLYHAAGAVLAFDAGVLGNIINLIEDKLFLGWQKATGGQARL